MSIGVKKNIFFIPYWVLSTLERNGLTLQQVLKLNSLSDVVCSEDLACVAVLNNEADKYFGFSIADSDSLTANWVSDSASYEKFHNHVEPLLSMVSRTLEVRLFDEAAKDERYPTPFTITDIDASTLMVVIYPGHFAGQDGYVHKKALMKQLLELFYAYEGFDRMARRHLFEQYMVQLT